MEGGAKQTVTTAKTILKEEEGRRRRRRRRRRRLNSCQRKLATREMAQRSYQTCVAQTLRSPCQNIAS